MVFSPISPSELIQQDREHLIHPLYHPDEHESPIIFAQGRGAILTDVEGNEYIDGLSCLWNVASGTVAPSLRRRAVSSYRRWPTRAITPASRTSRPSSLPTS